MSVLGTLARVGEGVATGGLSEAYRYATSASQAPGLPGSPTGPAPDPSRLRLDPATGQMIDPVTGARYTPTSLNPNGSTSGGEAIQNPTAATLVANNNQTATQVLAGLPAQQAAQKAALDAQRGQVASIDATINGTAPSVAQNQLTQSLGNINRNVESQAAGSGGQNAFAARRAAMATIGNNDIAAAEGAATTRAGETATAQGLKANVLNSIAGGANTQTAQTLDAGQGFSNLALTGETNREKTQAEIDEKNTAASSALKGQVIGAIAGIGAKAATGGAA